MIEIIIWNRGGQGGVFAKDILLDSVREKWPNTQGMPVFGAERRGAPVQDSIRVAGENEIPPSCLVEEPDCVVIFDQSLLKEQGPAKSISNLKPNGLLVINTPKEPSYFNQIYGVKIAVLNATAIALELGIGDKVAPFVNTAMAGAIARIFEFDLELLCESVRKRLGDKAEINIQAVRRGYEEVKRGKRK